MARDDDIIRDLVRRFRAVGTGNLPDDVWARLEAEARQAWAGDRVYVAAKPRDPEGKADRLAAAAAAGGSWADACAVAGISRSWAYELRRRRGWSVRPVLP